MALDCARLLLRPPDTPVLSTSDLAAHAAAALKAASSLSDVHLVARRGPVQVRFALRFFLRETHMPRHAHGGRRLCPFFCVVHIPPSLCAPSDYSPHLFRLYAQDHARASETWLTSVLQCKLVRTLSRALITVLLLHKDQNLPGLAIFLAGFASLHICHLPF